MAADDAEAMEARLAQLEQKLHRLVEFVADHLFDDSFAIVWDVEIMDVGTPDEGPVGSWVEVPAGYRHEAAA